MKEQETIKIKNRSHLFSMNQITGAQNLDFIVQGGSKIRFQMV